MGVVDDSHTESLMHVQSIVSGHRSLLLAKYVVRALLELLEINHALYLFSIAQLNTTKYTYLLLGGRRIACY